MMSPTTKIKRGFVAIGAVIILGGVNTLIAHKESIKRNGDVVYLDLAPVDPRSLMQGDYMTLDFRLAREIQNSFSDTTGSVRSKPMEGETRLVSVKLDEKRVASLSTNTSTNNEPLKIRYRMRDGRVWLGTNAFFFEEGKAAQYEGARYGEFRLDKDSGEAVLVGLRSTTLEKL
jgi:uncharacterized membrane-anchored protein